MTYRARGFLTFDQLRSGTRQQYAVDRSYGRVLIELRYEQRLDTFILTEKVTDPDGTHTTKETAIRLIGVARRAFTIATRKHP